MSDSLKKHQPLPSAALNDAFTAVEQQLKPVIDAEEGVLPAETLPVLRELIELAQAENQERIEQVGRALLAFVDTMEPEGGVIQGSSVQLQAMLDAIVQQLRPGEANIRREHALIRKPAQGERYNQTVCLMLDNESATLALESNLKIAGFSVEPIGSLTEIQRRQPERLPAAIIADLSLLRTDQTARESMQLLRADKPEAHLICLSASNEFDVRLEAVRLGATRFLVKPINYEKLVGILDGIMRRREVQPLRALLVDDDRALTALYKAVLEAAGVETEQCNKPVEVLKIVERFAPDVIVSDIYMPGCNGLELAAVLRQDENLFDTPIIFLSTETSMRRQLDALDLGGDEFLTKPVDIETFTATVIARAKRARMLKRTRRELETWKAQFEAALG